MIQVRRAIVSVSDKTGVVDFARGLAQRGVEILSTGGTGRALGEAGLSVTKVSDYTGAPEILGGRVKTLHPKIHGGLLARATDEHRAELEQNGIGEIDLVCVNLYPFEQTVAKPDVALQDAVENIDIGGPTMLRASAKNYERVCVVVDPADYPLLLEEMAQNDGALSRETRFRLAKKAFGHTAGYDAAIVGYLSSFAAEDGDRTAFPQTLSVQYDRELELRYGENPHQQAAFYAESKNPIGVTTGRPSLAGAEVLQGKALSYNNLLDLDGALGACLEFTDPTAIVIKHTNPCGAASAADVAEAYKQARECDPISAFGGIVAVNREVDTGLAELLVETFLECVVAPSYSAAARDILAKKKNLRLLALGDMAVSPEARGWVVRSVAGGVLVQSGDFATAAVREAKVVTKRAPTAEELDGLEFAWRIGKHVKSNAIVYCKGHRTVGVGAGQMSRIDSAKIARDKAQLSLEGSVAASDAFFPFRDGLDALADAGATAVVQPGGSIRDEEVIAAADERGVAMVFTGMRHFRH